MSVKHRNGLKSVTLLKILNYCLPTVIGIQATCRIIGKFQKKLDIW